LIGKNALERRWKFTKALKNKLMAREEKQQKIEVHVAGVCLRETESDIEILIVKRQESRKLYPGKWECGGGQVNAGENFEEAITRQIKEELGVIANKVVVFGTYQIETPDLEQKKIPGIKFVCFWDEYVNGKEPQIDPEEHSEWKWVSINKLSEVDFISGIDKDIRIGWDFYSANKDILEKNSLK
jgi:8-oxo-dGTP diphosphatase